MTCPRLAAVLVLLAAVVAVQASTPPLHPLGRARAPPTSRQSSGQRGRGGGDTAPIVPVFAYASSLAHAAVVIGNVTKSRHNPLFGQDKPWEPRLDNGYPMVVRGGGGGLQLWYGDCISSPGGGAPGCDQQVVLFASSPDGVAWTKPNLGVFNLSAAPWVRPDLKQYGTNNNIVMKGGGVGVFRDPNVARAGVPGAYKAFGVGCFAPGGGASSTEGCVSGIGSSADGITWGSAKPLNWPKPQRYDCEQNIMWDHDERDPTVGEYVLTTRTYNPPGCTTCGRSVALASSGTWDSGWPATVETIETGTAAAQLYSQVTFKWRGIYLGLVMVFDAESKAGRVHCRLAYSVHRDSGWRWVGSGGRDFLPLGPAGSFDSHIIFAAAHPIQQGSSGSVNVYYMGGNGPHFGWRNTSFAMAWLPPDRWAGIQHPAPRATSFGTGSFVISLVVTDSWLATTVDVGSNGFIQCSAHVAGGIVTSRMRVSGTNAPFGNGYFRSSLFNTTVSLNCTLENATVYTLTFVESGPAEGGPLDRDGKRS